MKKPIYVSGHKNPDIDSIVSAIAYSEYKKQLGQDAIACRLGRVSSDAEYILERFGFDEPLHIYSGKCTINEIDYDKAVLISKDLTIKEALAKVIKSDTRTLFITDKTKHLEGVLSLSNLNNLWSANEKYLASLLKSVSIKNLLKTLKAEVILDMPLHTNGILELVPDYSQYDERSIVVCSGSEQFANAVERKAGLIIIVGAYRPSSVLLKIAKQIKCCVIATDYNVLKVSKLIYQAVSVENVMVSGDQVVIAKLNETVENCALRISKSRYRSYPVLDENQRVVGAISRYHLLNYEKKRFILVDHNEKKQSIDDIDHGEVLEIIDHHKFGDFESANPILINMLPVGATSTIIARKFIDEKRELNKELASLLLCGILSDTMNLKSPTSTDIDINTIDELCQMTGLDRDDLYNEIIKHGETLSSRRSVDILYDDFKEYSINEQRIGISQAICNDESEYLAIKEKLAENMADILKTNHYDLFVCMFTDPTGSGSYLLSVGDRKDIIEIVYPQMDEHGFVAKVVSRKKQLLPDIIKVLS